LAPFTWSVNRSRRQHTSSRNIMTENYDTSWDLRESNKGNLPDEVKKKGYVPLCDLEVTSREDRNFWPVREYVV